MTPQTGKVKIKQKQYNNRIFPHKTSQLCNNCLQLILLTFFLIVGVKYDVDKSGSIYDERINRLKL